MSLPLILVLHKFGVSNAVNSTIAQILVPNRFPVTNGQLLQQHNDSADSVAADQDDLSVASTLTTNTATSRRSGRQGFQTATQGFQAKAITLRQVTRPASRVVAERHVATQRRKVDLKKLLVLDTGSSIFTASNSDFVEGIRISPTKMIMETNTGKKAMNLLAKLPLINQEVWYDPDQMTNILGFGGLIDEGVRITYDSAVEDAFYVHFPHQTLKFVRQNGVYA